MTACGYMITLISMPSKLWHQNFVEEYGSKFVDAIAKRFLDEDDSKIRELEANCTEQAISAIKQIKERLMPKA